MTDRIIALCILCLVFGLPLGVAAVFTGELILDFVFFWPLFMSVLWITGGLYFWFQLERHWPWGEDTPPPTLPGNPLISILIPCFNEEKNARETISAALAQRYANLEVIAINDGSSDNTAQVLQQLAQEEPRLRVIHLAANQGKAVALKAGAAAARGDQLRKNGKGRWLLRRGPRPPAAICWSASMATPCWTGIPRPGWSRR